MRYLKKRTSLNFTLYCNAMLLINFLPRDINLPNAQCMLNQLQTPMFAFQMKLFSDLTSKTFLYKIARYHQLFQCITHQSRNTNLFFLQVYLETSASKHTRICFGFYLVTERGDD